MKPIFEAISLQTNKRTSFINVQNKKDYFHKIYKTFKNGKDLKINNQIDNKIA